LRINPKPRSIEICFQRLTIFLITAGFGGSGGFPSSRIQQGDLILWGSTLAGNENEELFENLAAEATLERIGEAVPRLRTAEWRQVKWSPVSREELVPDDHRVRAVWRFGEGLDLSRCSARSNPSKGGPAIRRRIRASCWLCAYSRRSRAWQGRGPNGASLR
jgi:hypothetical protein